MRLYTVAERVWYGSELPVFLERFILVVLATAFWQVIIVNAMKLDIHYRIGIALVLVGGAYITAHAVQSTKSNGAAGAAVVKPEGAKAETTNAISPRQTIVIPKEQIKPHISHERHQRAAEKASSHIGDDNTVVNAPVPADMGSGNTILGATDDHSNAIYSKGGTAIGKNAHADSTSVAIGANANAGDAPKPIRPATNPVNPPD